MARFSLKLASCLLFLIFLLAFSLVYSQEFRFQRNLYFGLKNDSDVSRLQQFLTDQGFYSGPVNGNFFALTKSAVIKFQKEKGIAPAEGFAGPKTREVLNNELIASTLPKTPAEISGLIDKLLAQIKQLEEKLSAAKAAEEAQKIQVAPEPVPQPTPTPAPAPQVKTPLDSSLKIIVTYPSRTLSIISNSTITELNFSDDAIGEKVIVKRIVFTNGGTLNASNITNLRLIHSKTGVVLATAANPKNGVIEFKLNEDATKLDNGFIVSNNIYSVTADLITPNTTLKPTIKLDIVSQNDIEAFDYNDQSNKALITKFNIFPITGPTITLP